MSYRMVHLRIRSKGYNCRWESDMDEAAFRKESRRVFQELGWALKPGGNGICDIVTKGNQDLYLHPSDFSGVMDEANMADRYTAIATYTGTATSSYVKGYTVTADYSGAVSRIALNKVRYVAIFEGVPLIPVVEEPTPEPTPDAQAPTVTAIQFHWAYVLVPLGVIALAGAGVGAALFVKKRRENDDGAEDSGDE